MAATWFNRDAISEQAELDRVKVEMAKEELEYWKKRNAVKPVDKNFGFGLTGTTRTTTRQETSGPVLRPKARPTLGDKTVPLFLPDGQQWDAPRQTAKRLGLNPWDTVLAGDYAEIVGELRGEGESAAAVFSIGKAQNLPVFGRPNSTSLEPIQVDRPKLGPLRP